MSLRFAADKTVGKLAKWLRILGFDTRSVMELPAGCCGDLEPGRILLTRRASFRRNRGDNPRIMIQSDHYCNQIVEVIQAVGITTETIRPFSRCVCCNAAIIPVDKADLQGKVPDYVWETHQTFRICQGCQRIYWAGSHIDRSMEMIRRLFSG